MIKKFLIILALIIIPLSVSAQGLTGTIQQVGEGTNLPSFDLGHGKQSYQSGISQITSILYYIIDFFKYILGSIAVIMIIVSGAKLILSGRNVQEIMTKEKATISFSLYGLLMIVISEQIIKIFFGEEGEIYRTGADLQMAAQQGSAILLGITNLLRIIIPSLAILFFMVAAYRLLTSQGDAEKLNKTKTQIIWSILGLILAGTSEIIIYTIVYPRLGQSIPDTQAFSRFVVTMTNFVSGFITTISAIMIIYAGYLYVISVGSQELDKAKNVLKGAIIGLLIAMSAFALVNTLIKLDPVANIPQQTQSQVNVP